MIKEIPGKRGTTYSVRWQADGRQQAVNVKTKRQAVRLDAWLKLNRGVTREQALTFAFGEVTATAKIEGGGPTVDQLWSRYQHGLTVSRARLATLDALWDSQLADWHGTRAREVKASDVTRWLAELREAYAPETVAAAFRLLKSLFLVAEADRQLVEGYNPLRYVKTPPVKRTKLITDADVLSPAEVFRVIAAAGERYRGLWAFLIATGARLGEGLGLRPVDLDLDAGRYRIAQRTVEVAGVITVEAGTKTGEHDTRADEWLELTGWAVAELRAQLERHPRQPGELIFTNSKGNTPSRSSLRQRDWSAALEAAGVPYVTIRNLRHTAVTHGLAAGISATGMAARVGHSRASALTLDRYARVLPQQVDSDAGKIGEFYAGYEGGKLAGAGKDDDNPPMTRREVITVTCDQCLQEGLGDVTATESMTAAFGRETARMIDLCDDHAGAMRRIRDIFRSRGRRPH